MAKQVYWLSDAEWRRIEPLLPRGRKRGASGRRSPGDQWDRLYAALWSAVAGLPGSLWALHHDL
jgi:transposase